MPRVDALLLRGLSFFGHHGVLKAEQTLGQRFVVDMRVETDLGVAGKSDALADSLDYVELYNIVKEVVEGPAPRRRLVEALAQDIAQRVLDEHARASSVQVTITKPHVAVPNVDALGVEIFRSRS
jgi:7,8-dihydroneopterin aldolase/epimerase/oxygenase